MGLSSTGKRLQKVAFTTINEYPGYVIDHVVLLKRGGPDDPSNMQWQTTAAAKAKDKIE